MHLLKDGVCCSGNQSIVTLFLTASAFRTRACVDMAQYLSEVIPWAYKTSPSVFKAALEFVVNLFARVYSKECTLHVVPSYIADGGVIISPSIAVLGQDVPDSHERCHSTGVGIGSISVKLHGLSTTGCDIGKSCTVESVHCHLFPHAS